MSSVTRHLPGTPCWIDLSTSDIASARAFYGALFGWEIDPGSAAFGGYTTARRDGKRIAGLVPAQPGSGFPSAWSVYFASDDAAATAAAITANGGQLMVPPMVVGDHGTMAVAVDPTGAVFGVWQPNQHTGAELVSEPGTLSWCEVNTRDAEAAVAFYGKVFDLIGERLETPMPTAYYTLHKGVGSDAVAGVLQMTEHWAGVPPHWMVYFAVPDIGAAADQVEALGGKVVVAAFDTPAGRLSIVNDPQGAVFTLIQPK